MFAGIYSGRRVLVTGHTGFKGAWLSRWLMSLGAEVGGYALPPPTKPSLFASLAWDGVDHAHGDVRDAVAVAARIGAFRPEIVFHLAAQSLVRRSYAEPGETFATNVLGTVNVLESVRRAGRPCAVVVVTSDKCYEETDDPRPRRESDPLGGRDPYSASKGAAEIATAAYGRAFFPPDGRLALSTARAGNVIGGGDWAEDRLVPDCIRALKERRSVPVRRPGAVRPWQHVLEPLGGYLWLGARLWQTVTDRARRPSPALNFGPEPEAHQPVRVLVEEVLRHWPGKWETVRASGDPHENECLRLATDLARQELGWRPVWKFSEAVRRTVEWYRRQIEASVPAADLVAADLDAYAQDAAALGLPWTR